MSDWSDKAREMRHSGASIATISSSLGVTAYAVKEACKGINGRYGGHWHEEAREMRRAGESLRAIADKLDRSHSQVRLATLGVQPARKPSWRPQARKLRADGLKLIEIARQLDVSESSVKVACVGVACPIDHNKLALAAANERRAESAKTRERVYRPRVRVIDEVEQRRRRIARMMFADNGRIKPPITLPTIKFLDRVSA